MSGENIKEKEIKRLALVNQLEQNHKDTCEDTNNRIRGVVNTKTFWAGIIASVLLTGFFHWNLGYPISSQFGVVPEDAISAGEMHLENKLLRNENAALKIKLNQINLEMVNAKRWQQNKLEIMYAVFHDDEKYLERIQLEDIPENWEAEGIIEWLTLNGHTNILQKFEAKLYKDSSQPALK